MTDAATNIYREANELFAVIHGAPPSAAQWAAVKLDLAAVPAGGRWWLRKYGRPLVLVGGPVCLWPGCEHLPPTLNGVGLPTPVVSVPLAYPITPTGVGGAGVVLHELGHTLSPLLDGAFGNTAWPASRQGPWRATWVRQNWEPFGLGYARDPEEAFAESFKLWCLVRAGRPPTAADLSPILDYWDTTARSAGWL